MSGLFGNSFGNSNPLGGANASSSLPGGNSTTSSATNNQSALFGSKPTGGSFFGNNTSTGTGGLFGGTTSTTNPPSGGLFSTPSNTAPGSGLFGSTPSTQNTGNATATSAFGLPKPADQTISSAPKPPTSGLFGQQSTAPSTTPVTGTGLFSLPPKPADASGSNASQTAGASTTSGGIFGGGLFGKGPTTGSTASPAPAAATLGSGTGTSFSLGGNKDSAAPTTSLFGSVNATTKASEKKDTPATTTPAVGLFGAAKTDDKKQSPTSNTSLAPLAKDAEKSKDSKEVSATANVVAVPPPSMLRGKSLEEIINRWTSELETHVKEFSKFAGEVAVWDRALIENGNNLAALYSHVLAAERQQNEIDQSLDHIEQQQKDLSSTLDTYEKVSNELLGGQGGGLRALDTGPADTERDKNYMLAADLHTQLDDLSGSLTQMIESVNSLSLTSKPSEVNGDDPMAQIAQILSSHLESLQWIDVAVRDVESKVVEVEKRVKESGHTIPNGSINKPRAFGNNR